MTQTPTSPAAVVPEVETIRRAATLMRERATAATPGPWESLDGGDRLVAWKVGPGGFDDDFDYVVDEPMENAANAEHIASWHPTVALTVAHLLEQFVDNYPTERDTPECPNCTDGLCGGHEEETYHMRCGWSVSADCPCIKPVLAVARAYLGDESA